MAFSVNELVLREVEAFCARTGISTWRFGMLFGGDRKLAAMLRDGVGITTTRINDFMARAAEWEAEHPAGGDYIVRSGGRKPRRVAADDSLKQAA